MLQPWKESTAGRASCPEGFRCSGEDLNAALRAVTDETRWNGSLSGHQSPVKTPIAQAYVPSLLNKADHCQLHRNLPANVSPVGHPLVSSRSSCMTLHTSELSTALCFSQMRSSEEKGNLLQVTDSCFWSMKCAAHSGHDAGTSFSWLRARA